MLGINRNITQVLKSIHSSHCHLIYINLQTCDLGIVHCISSKFERWIQSLFVFRISQNIKRGPILYLFSQEIATILFIFKIMEDTTTSHFYKTMKALAAQGFVWRSLKESGPSIVFFNFHLINFEDNDFQAFELDF